MHTFLMNLIYGRPRAKEIIEAERQIVLGIVLKQEQEEFKKFESHLYNTGRCCRCGDAASISYLIKLPNIERIAYLKYLKSTGNSHSIRCCACMDKFVNSNFINKDIISNIKGYSPHEQPWFQRTDLDSKIPVLKLPKAPTVKITEALENMYYLPEGAETYPEDEYRPRDNPRSYRIYIGGHRYRDIAGGL